VHLLAAALVVAAMSASAAFGADGTPVRDCGSSAYGDLGARWRERAVIAGPVAFAGLRGGYRFARAAPPGKAWPRKVLLVVEPQRTATIRIAAASAPYAALGYHELRFEGGRPVPLAAGTRTVRFVACRATPSREPWNRGTQFPGYFLVRGAKCVRVDVVTPARTYRRTLRFGAADC
jgi:hypothetical protein